MPRLKTLKEAYEECKSKGSYRQLEEVNAQKVKSLIENAQVNLNSANIIANAIDKKAKEWMNVFILHYDALRIYAEGLLHLKSIDSGHHQGIFAALCTTYPSLELSWEFLEEIRTIRNGINYYGKHISYEDWKKHQVQIILYLDTLRKELEKKL